MVTVTSPVPGVHVLEKTMPDFTVRAFVLVGSRRAVVLDTLTTPQDMAPALPLLADRDVFVVYSHADWDHIQGTAALPGIRAIIAHAACAQRVWDEAAATLATLQQEAPGVYDAVTLFPPDLTVDDSLTLDLGGLSLALHHLPGHTADSLVGFVPEHGLFLPADTVETPLPSLDWDDVSLEAWVDGLVRWRDAPGLRQVIPSHGDAGGRDVLDQTIQYLRALQQGDLVMLPEGLPSFYADAHTANIARVARQR